MSDSDATVVHDLLVREIPEIAAGRIQIIAIVRQPGFRSKVALHCVDQGLDAIGTCVGPKGSRIKKLIEALKGERIDLVRWSEDPKTLIARSLEPAAVQAVVLDEVQRRATVFVTAEQHPLAMGHRGVNLQLASDLCGYEIVVETITK